MYLFITMILEKKNVLTNSFYVLKHIFNANGCRLITQTNNTFVSKFIHYSLKEN